MNNIETEKITETEKRVCCKTCKKLLFKTKVYAIIKGVEINIMCRGRGCYDKNGKRTMNSYVL